MPLAIRLFSFFLHQHPLSIFIVWPVLCMPSDYYNYSALAALEWPFKNKSNSTLLHSGSSSEYFPPYSMSHPKSLWSLIWPHPIHPQCSITRHLWTCYSVPFSNGPSTPSFGLSSYSPLYCPSSFNRKYLRGTPLTAFKPLLQGLPLPHSLSLPLCFLLPIAGIF